MNKYELLKQIDQMPHRHMVGKPTTFYLPTEAVVIEPQIVTPMQGRYYELDLYVRTANRLKPARNFWLPEESPNGIPQYTLLASHELRVMPDFKGVHQEIRCHLYELWGDCGSDGHVDYRQHGWMIYPGIHNKPHCMYNQMQLLA